MNKIFTVLSAVLISASLWAQAPQSFSYQAVVRSANNILLANKPVGMKISLLQGSENGTTVYVETHKPTSNANGLVSIAIGGGAVVSGTFASIDWSKGPYFVKTETDPAGGSSYSLITTSQLLSVPYAFISGNGIKNVSNLGDTLFLQNGSFVIIPGLSTANPKSKPTSGYGSNITDVEGNTYKTVYIGSQQWMAENLKVTKYNDGSVIPNVTDNVQWSKLTTGAWSNYNNDAANNAKYGKLYNWYVVNSTTNVNKNVCPSGWHVPADAEWTVLTDYLGGSSVAGGKLKEVGTTNWNSPNTDASNISLFSAHPGGNRNFDGNFVYVGFYGTWWSSPENGTSIARGRFLSYDASTANMIEDYKTYGLSVRCLKD